MTRRAWGILRSFLVYWRPGRQRRLRALYAPFVRSGDLVFDVGAHLGDRTAAFAALGARVVALEPQPRLRRWLDRLVRRRPGVTVRSEAVGSASGTARMAVSDANPSVSTLAAEWRDAVLRSNPTFRRVRWERSLDVAVTTLDALIDEYGEPSFCKIDVEGYEARVLAGLSRPLPVLSVEFVAGTLPVAVACVHRLRELGEYEFNAIPGEERHFLFPRWMGSLEAEEWLEAGAGAASSGDLYARLRSAAR